MEVLDRKIIFYDFGEFRLDAQKEKLYRGGEAIALTHKAFQTLCILVANSGEVIEKEEIISKIWTDSFVEESNLSQYVYLLRKTLGKDENGNQLIETVNKQGFRFRGKVNKVYEAEAIVNQSNGSSSIFPSPENDTTIPSSSLAKEESPVKRSSRLSLFSLSLVPAFLIIAALAVYFLYFRQVSKENAAVNSVAVLPFKTIGSESDDPKLGLGMADSVIMRLGALQKIPVRSTSAIFQFTDQPNVDAVSVGKQLGVDSVLEGTIQRDGEKVRVSTRLLRVSDGKLLWANVYDSRYDGVFELQDLISTKVAEALSLNLSQDEKKLLTERPTTNSEAQQAYQMGVYFWNSRTKEGLEKAADYFQKAIEKDENFALAYAMLADSYNMLGYYNFANREEMLQKSRPIAEKALQLNEKLAEAHLAMAYILQNTAGQQENGIKSLERAIELSPYNAAAHIRYGWTFLERNNLDETVRQMRLAQENDPLSPTANNTLCTALYFQHNFAEAAKYCEKAFEISPDSPANRLTLANVYFFNDKKDKAIELAQKELNEGKEKNEKVFALALLGYFYSKTNQTKEAEKIYEELKPGLSAQPKLIERLILLSYTLGRKEETTSYLAEAMKNRSLSQGFRFDPLYDELRNDLELKIS